MWVFTDIADWFDRQKAQANRVLDEAVEAAGYNQGAMIAAAGTHAVMEFGGAFVDLLRLGDGVKQGGWRGWGADGLRMVAIFPVGKAAQMAKSIKGVKLAKVVPDPMTKAPICAWVASAKVLAHLGYKMPPQFKNKLYAKMDDLVEAVGIDRQLVDMLTLTEATARLRQVNVKAGMVKRVTNMRQVEQMVPHDGSVVMVAVRDVNYLVNKTYGHMIYVYREWGGVGRIRIMDRTITNLAHSPYTRLADLTEVIRKNGNAAVTELVPFEAAVLQNTFVPSVSHGANKLLVPIPAVVGSYEED